MLHITQYICYAAFNFCVHYLLPFAPYSLPHRRGEGREDSESPTSGGGGFGQHGGGLEVVGTGEVHDSLSLTSRGGRACVG